IMLFVFLLSGSIVFSNETLKGFVLFWDNSNEKIFVDSVAPPGTSLDDTERYTSAIEDMVIESIPEKELVSISSTIGSHASANINLEGNHENWSTVQVKLVPVTDRDRWASEIAEELRNRINTEALPAFQTITINEEKKGPPTGSPVDIKVISSNDQEAQSVTNEIKQYLGGINGIKDLDDDQKAGKPELVVNFNYDLMAQYGITVNTVASTIYTAFEGTDATYVQYSDDDVDFKVQVDERYKNDRSFILDLLVPNSTGKLIRIGEFASLERRAGKSAIHHYNGERAITICANVNEDVITSGQATMKVKRAFSDISEKYPGTYLVYAGEAKESGTAMRDLAIAFGTALIAIYLLIVFLFRSITQPFIIISVIPFGLIGVLTAFTLHGIPLNFMGIIGIIGLSGVVVNDSILMVEFINREYKRNRTPDREALIGQISEGAKQRLRPIILTTITTVAALLPTVYGIGGNAASIVPTVMAMAYGLLFASFLTLFFIPSLYLVNVDMENGLQKLVSKLFSS
ncbi:MAG: efflux RND transporter permease subunit, partial [Spirochaetota bacterium]